MPIDYDVVIVGGGPTGCAVARDIAAAGFKVLILEEHYRVGKPLQCAGLVSIKTLELARVSPQVVLHKLIGARVHAPGGQVLNLTGKQIYALAIDRIAFDRELSAQALAVGAKIHHRTRVTNLTAVPGGVKVKTRLQDVPPSDSGLSNAPPEQCITCRLVIGADGYNSLVARWLGLSPPLEKIPLYAAEVELPDRQDQIVDIFLGRETAPGWFGWIIPAGQGKARVGIGSARLRGLSNISPRVLFQLLVKAHPETFKKMRIIRNTSGLVPIGFMPETYGPHALLVGDAACQVKPISGGGLYLGLEAARLCAATAIKALQAGDCSKEFLSRYQRAWEEKIGPEIRCGLAHRETFLNLSDQEMDKLITFFNKPYWRKLILKYGDVDYHSLLAGKLTSAPSWAQHFVFNKLKTLLS